MTIIKNNPNAITYIPDPSDELKFLAVKNDGFTLKYIENPTQEMQFYEASNLAYV
jgi:hypothetical protein